MAKTAKLAKANSVKVEVPAVDRTTAYLDGGRVSQKLRTRDALVNGAADLIRRGQPVSVTEVADAARVSRTTAYRYFPTSEMLSAQASLFVAGSIETQHLDDLLHGTGTPEEKLDAVIAGSDAMTATNESAFRSLLRYSLEANAASKGGSGKGLPRRPPFRRQWIEIALADVKKDLGAKRFNRLSGALSLLCGVESFVVLQDICAMSADEAREAKRWAAQLLLRAALAESEDTRSAGAKGKVKKV
jgi:AcrR family transcriptional regulator